jgi:hypothetical protein
MGMLIFLGLALDAGGRHGIDLGGAKADSNGAVGSIIAASQQAKTKEPLIRLVESNTVPVWPIQEQGRP